MALSPVCGVLKSGQDLSCKSVISRFYQQLVLINYSDIDGKTINTESTGSTCNHNVSFTLKTGKEGFRFMLSENGTAVSGTYEKSVNDFGYPTFRHIVNMALAGADEATKCAIESLSKGRFVAALQMGEIIEIYGIEQGLAAGDFTADPQGNSGFIPLTLESSENAPEGHVPLVYKAGVPGQEIEDFDANFKQGA